MAKKESCDKLALIPINNAQKSSSIKPASVSFRTIDTKMMAMSAIFIPIFPAIISVMYLYLLLSMWYVLPTMM